MKKISKPFHNWNIWYGYCEIIRFESRHILAQRRSDKYILCDSISTVAFEVFQSLKCKEKQIQEKNVLSTVKRNTACDYSSVEIAHSQKNCQILRCYFEQSDNYKCWFTNLIRRTHRLYSSLSFSSLGNAKNLQVWLSDEWLHVGAKQYTIVFVPIKFFGQKAIIFK